MTDTLKDSRLSGASSLHGEIESLLKVDPTNRQSFVHDRLMSAIDAICEEHKSGQGAVFNQKQMLVLKDIAYHLTYLLDPLNKSRKGFLHNLKTQFLEAQPITRVGWIVGSIVFIVPASTGTYQSVSSVIQYAKTYHVVKVEEANGSSKSNAANSPSTSATPAHSAPPP